MIDAPHERYRDRLAALATDQPLLEPLRRAGQALGWWTGERTWRRSYARFAAGADAYAMLVLESDAEPQALAVVEIFEQRPAESPRLPVFPAPDLGWIRIESFAEDPALPTLPEVLRARRAPVVARYRPRHRCTIRFGVGSRARYAKVFAGDGGARIHEAGMALWAAAARGELGFQVARPDRWDPRTRTLWQYAVPGHPLVDRLVGSAGPALVRRIGAAAGSLTRASLPCDERFDAAAQLERTRRAATALGRLVPGLARPAGALLQRLADVHATVVPRPLRPIHGAPHPSQWLDDGEVLGLVDFDRAAAGDPELDVATFLAELEAEGDRQAPMEQLEGELIAAYEAAAGPLDAALLRAYRGHKRLAKAHRSARALVPDGDARAARHLAFAAEAL